MSKRKLTYENFKRYFSNNLPNEEKHAFEKDMMSDAFEDEAFDGLSGLSDEDLVKDIAELKAGIQNRGKNKKRIIPGWFQYAASVLILVGIGLSVFVLLNHRLWQDSMNKEQFSQELEIADSTLFDAEFKVSKQDTGRSAESSIKQKPPKLLADNKKIKKAHKVKEEMRIVEDKAEISDETVLDEDKAEEVDTDHSVEIMEFKAEEEVKEEEQPVLAAVTGQKADETDKQQNIVIRGSSSISNSKKSAPIMVIDGKLIDPNNAKTIQGKILNEEDQSSIPGVSLVLKDMPAIGTVSDSNGEFKLTIPEDEELKTLIASFVGMESQEIKLEEDSNLLVYMEPQVMAMDEVVVSGVGKRKESYDKVERINALPPGEVSIVKYKKEILDKLDFTKFSQYPGKYKIKISIHLTSMGQITNIELENSPDKVFDNEIKKIIKSLGAWIPAIEAGRSISSTVNFNLKIEVSE